MTYLAPRQGLFAIIILISFFIHTTLLLISTDQQLDELKMQTGKRMLVQLIEEVKLPLLSNDKVSLSVLTGRYTSENSVASLTIKDVNDDVILQTGQAQLMEGDTIREQVIMGDNVIGSVQMTLRDTSNGEIIASQWLFILGSFIVHLLIWLLYGYIARPTRAQLAQLSRDVKEHLRVQSRTLGTGPVRQHDDKAEQQRSGLKEPQAVSDYIRGHQSTANSSQKGQTDKPNATQQSHTTVENPVDQTHVNNRHEAAAQTNSNQAAFGQNAPNQTLSSHSTDSHSKDSYLKESGEAATNMSTTSSTSVSNGSKPASLVSTRPLKKVSVLIQFYDPNHLIDTLAAEKSKPYLALCSQLLDRTITELLKQPLLFGVSVSNTPTFDAKGATVELTCKDDHNKVALAAMMLARVYVMLNQVTYIKHRELKRFALEVRVGVSDHATSSKMSQLLTNNAKVNDILVLLPVAGLKQLSGNMQLNNLQNPTTVYERDCARLSGVSEPIMTRLITVRDAVLLSANS